MSPQTAAASALTEAEQPRGSAVGVLVFNEATERTEGILAQVKGFQGQFPIGIRMYKSEQGGTLEVLAEETHWRSVRLSTRSTEP